jgi:hypothetical protein
MRIDSDDGDRRRTDGDRQRGRQGQDREAATVQAEAESREQPEAPTVQPVISTLPHMRIRRVCYKSYPQVISPISLASHVQHAYFLRGFTCQ